MIWPTIAEPQKKKFKKTCHKCWQPIKMLWQMQQNVCCIQDNDAISSATACWSEYGILSASSQALTNSWAHQETTSSCTCIIVGACLWWFFIVYQIIFFCNFIACLGFFCFFCLFVYVLYNGNCCLYCFVFYRFGLPAFAAWHSFPMGGNKRN